MVDARRDRGLFLFRLRVQRGQRQQWIRRGDGAFGKTGEERRDGFGTLGALSGPRAHRLTRGDTTSGFGARNSLREAQAGLLLQPLNAHEKERAVPGDRPSDRPTELIQRQFLLLVIVLARGVQRVAALVLEERARKAVRPALGHHGDVAARTKAALGRSKTGVDSKLRNGLHRGLQPELRASGIQVARAGVPHVSTVYAIEVQVVLLIRLAVEANARPAAVAVARGTGGQGHQVGKVAAVHWKALNLFGRHVDANLGRREVDDIRGCRHRDRFLEPRDGKHEIERLDLS